MNSSFTKKSNPWTNLAAIALLTAMAPTACSSSDSAAKANPPATVASVDVQRYLGTWYQQALIPNRFQSMCASDTSATYSLDGTDLRVLNRCKAADGSLESAKGVAKIVEGSNNAKLRVSFFRPFYGDYWVLALDPNYQWVLVGEPSRQYGWVLSRNAKLDDATFTQIMSRATEAGYDKAQFVKSLHGL